MSQRVGSAEKVRRGKNKILYFMLTVCLNVAFKRKTRNLKIELAIKYLLAYWVSYCGQQYKIKVIWKEKTAKGS